ncbi:MAG: AAA family ATPase [Clostridium sp.]|uniref:ATP-dependent nuclease n=1 Tax=Clostridium sp. TaxID=1506 RepID=UPI002A914FB8|nr:AAA family ATPase [Clostridium sp.]MDY6228291.1 AAA family ATPase [Clostridium sp.]
MYLKSLKIVNFRKFRTEENIIEFVDTKSYQEQKNSKEINIASTTTLIVGKNNCGKTTVIQALDKLINENKFNSNDFNFLYIKDLLNSYRDPLKDIRLPMMEFVVSVGIDESSTDLITNLIPFMILEDVNKSELDIIIKYEIQDSEIFISNVKQLLIKYNDENLIFNKFLKVIDESKFSLNYYNKSGEKIKQFKLKDLMELKSIKANNIEGENCLSKAFSKIVEYRYNILLEDDKEKLEEKIIQINSSLTKKINNTHTKYINNSLGKVVSNDKLKVLLSADLTFQKLMNSLVNYKYVEDSINIPENQFGLGYTNLMMIIANLIDYMEKYPDNSFNSKINLISIEEPETFMHPQMQELFIKNINDAITTLLEVKNKNINSQLIITTHSAHILNSKIHSGNTFNNINYITNKKNCANVVNLNDKEIVPESDTKDNDLKYLKKHIKYKVSELFFSDAIIFVEGITEYTLLPYYIDQNKKLSKYYISIFNIDGAHGLVYSKLIKLLKVPTLIITDIDIKREAKEKENFKQITNLKDRNTTNQTIIKNNGNNSLLEHLPDYINDENMYIIYQGKINRYYATSFEEALILTNYKNILLNNVLKKIKPKIYKEITDENLDNNKKNSYKWQCKLSSDKSEFANELLYSLITEGDRNNIPVLPKYIDTGLEILVESLKGDNIT